MGRAFLKKAASVVVALALLAQMTVVPAFASTNVYAEDFEGKALSDLTYSLAGNTTARILSNTAGNSTDFFNYYTSGAGGNRESNLTISSSGLGAGAGVQYSMKLRLMGSNTNGSEIKLVDTSKKTIFSLATGASYLGSPTINGESVSLTTSRLAANILGVSGYDATGWLQFDARIDFRTTPASVNLKVTDITNNNAVVYENITTTEATNISALYGTIGRSNGAIAYDDITVDTLSEEEMGDAKTYYTVTYSASGVSSDESVESGASVANIPSTDKTGYIFQGWSKDGDTTTLYTNEQLAALAITADTTFTAVYAADPNYIEALSSVEFVMPNGNFAVMSDSTDVFADNNISIKMIGELGNDITNSRDSRVTDFNVDWEFLGYDVLNGEPTGDLPTGIDGEYALCDSYGYVTGATADSTAVNFKLKNTTANYYGIIRATVTYNAETIVIENPFVILGNTTQDSSVVIPRGGYVADYNLYSDGLVGYVADVSSDNRDGDDSVLGEWWTAGSSSGRKLQLASDDGGKFLNLSTDTTNGSCFAAFQSESQTEQVIIDQMVRFHSANSTILFKSVNPVTWTTGAATSLTINFTGSAMTINGVELLADASTEVWYRIVASVDASSGICYAIVYDEDGEELGRSEQVAFTDAGSVTPKYYCFRVPDRAAGSLDFNNVIMTKTAVDSDTVNLQSTQTTIAIPQTEGETAEATISLEARTTSGYEATGLATWSIGDESISNVTVTTGADSHTATVTVGYEAPAGDLPVKVVIGGVEKEIVLKLTGTQDNVVFTSAPASVSIPADADASAEYVYAAEVRDGEGSVIADKEVTYALYDSKNVNVLTDSDGVTLSGGTLIVTAAAQPQVVYIRAISTNSDGKEISKSVKVTIHGLAFDFGTADEGTVAEGYTAVTASDIYSTAKGYGIEGTATAGGTVTDNTADEDYLSGSFVFKADVTPGKVYNVTVNYTGSMAYEKVNSDLTGVSVTSDGTAAAVYEIANVDGVLDLNFTSAQVSSIMIEAQEDKTASAKPTWHAIGDSTIANNGSWAYVLARDIADYSVLGDLVTFSNRGRGGRNLSTYYTEGIFNSVLKDIRPGDIVSISGMGTNGMGSYFEDDLNFYIDACKAMGARVVLGSYTPHGAVSGYESGYDAETQVFDSYRRDSYDVTVSAVYEERADELLGFVDIGKLSDAAFNAAVVAARVAAGAKGKTDEEIWAAGEAKAQEIIACFGDHNHYSDGTLACSLILGAIVPEMAKLAGYVEEPAFGITECTNNEGTVTVKAADAIAGKVIFGMYLGGTLLDSVIADAAADGTAQAEFTILNHGKGDFVFKAFNWDSVSGMKPVNEADLYILSVYAE